MCVGRNYPAHAAEMGNEVPSEPLIFLKPPSSLITSGEAVLLPAGAGRVDYEGEIAFTIGRSARRVKAADALDFVAGVLPLNDVTARELQRKDSQWARAKGFDTFCPIGAVVPFDPEGLNGLSVITTVNGEERQRGRAVDQVFPLQYVLEYVTAFMTLEVGDIIATGAPAGVGPLRDGDVVRVEVAGVGAVENPVVAEAEE